MLPAGHAQITGLGSVKGLGNGTSDGATPRPVPAGTSLAIVQCEGGTVRWRDDGVNPTATIGMLMADGDVLRYDDTPLSALKFFAASGTPKLNVAFYKGSPLSSPQPETEDHAADQ